MGVTYYCGRIGARYRHPCLGQCESRHLLYLVKWILSQHKYRHSVSEFFKATVPYLICILALVVLLIMFPGMATIIPYSM